MGRRFTRKNTDCIHSIPEIRVYPCSSVSKVGLFTIAQHILCTNVGGLADIGVGVYPVAIITQPPNA